MSDGGVRSTLSQPRREPTLNPTTALRIYYTCFHPTPAAKATTYPDLVPPLRTRPNPRWP